MSKREICRLVIQLMGVYLFVSHLGAFLSSAGTMGVMMAQFGEDNAWWGVAGSIIMMAGGLMSPVFGVLLVVYSGKITSLVMRGDDVCSAENLTPVTRSDIMGIVVACIGLYVAVSALGKVIYYLSTNIMLHMTSERSKIFQLSMLIGEVVKLCVGLWLFAGYRAFVRFWDRRIN